MSRWNACGGLFALSLVIACERPPPPPPPAAPAPAPASATAPAPPKPEPSEAELRSLSDAFVRDWIAGARHAAYLKMERRYRASSTEARFGGVMDGLSRNFGKILEAKLDSTEVGTSLSFSGFRKIWGFLYDVRTEAKPNGGYQAKVTLTADPELGVSSFTYVVLGVTVPKTK